TYSPVKAILFTSGCCASAAPAVGPNPGTTLKTPSGIPASAAIRASSIAVIGVGSAGLSTTGVPPRAPGAVFQVAMMNGPFHGVMPPTTPSGSRSVDPRESPGRLHGVVEARVLVAPPAPD